MNKMYTIRTYLKTNLQQLADVAEIYPNLHY